MVRKQIYITEEQDKRIKKIKEHDGVPQAVTIRKAINQYLNKSGVKGGDCKCG